MPWFGAFDSIKPMKFLSSKAARAALIILAIPVASWVIAATISAMTLRDGSVPRGITQGEVMTTKGQPTQEIGPIGDPPISKWIYADGEVVVFEYDRVVDSFVRPGS